uniref:Uncharacterized protein n=1 Tax=Oreochromis aureus TaxID=47969 RepID=A0AAZ1XNQ5_OREAU
MVTRPCSLTDEDEAFMPGERDTLRKSMTLMRHLLMDAQVQLPSSLKVKHIVLWTPNFFLIIEN